MKAYLFLFVAFVLNLSGSTDAQAAFVQYRDENGKVHHVNTDYSKVPERYRRQVEEQLRAIEEKKKAASQQAPIVPAPTGTQKNITPQLLANPFAVDNTPSTPITNGDRIARFTKVVTDLQTIGFYPPGVDTTSGLINYIDRQGKKNPVTPATLPGIPKEYLPHIDSQIITLETVAKQAKAKKTFNPSNTVEVFTKTDCSDCVRLMVLLKAHKIDYLNYDVENSTVGKDFYMSTPDAELPITRVKGTLIKGVEVSAIKNALQKQ